MLACSIHISHNQYSFGSLVQLPRLYYRLVCACFLASGRQFSLLREKNEKKEMLGHIRPDWVHRTELSLWDNPSTRTRPHGSLSIHFVFFSIDYNYQAIDCVPRICAFPQLPKGTNINMARVVLFWFKEIMRVPQCVFSTVLTLLLVYLYLLFLNIFSTFSAVSKSAIIDTTLLFINKFEYIKQIASNSKKR